MGRGGGGGEPFAVAAERLAAQASRNAQMRAALPGGGPGIRSGIEMRVDGLPPSTRTTSDLPYPSAPVRVGGNIRPPRKLVDVPPVVPEQAQQAGISGVVILEVTIGPDGGIADAKVLRSVPLLDQAALEAVRQWRYEPTHLNGAAVPVIMTVTVRFDSHQH